MIPFVNLANPAPTEPGTGLTEGQEAALTTATRRQPVASIAALKALTPSAGDAVNVLGYTAAGDGGGGTFYYDGGSSATDNGGTVIAPDTGSGRWLRAYSGAVNVRWFGAKGDGVTDDQVPLSRAASLGKPIYVPHGTYAHSDIITISAGGIYGDGALSVLLATNPLKAAVIISGTGVFVQRLKLSQPLNTSPSADVKACGVRVGSQATQFLISEVTVDGFSNASISVGEAASFGSITRNIIKNCRVNSIHISSHELGGAHDIVIDSNNISNGIDDMIISIGWAASGAFNYNITITNNIINSNSAQGRGIVVGGTKGAIVSGNQIRDNYGAGILVIAESGWNVLAAERIVVSNNIITNCPKTNTNYGAIHVLGQSGQVCTDITIKDNIIDTCVAFGIALINFCKDVSITGNRLRNIGSRAIYAIGVENVRVDGNDVSAVYGEGVRIANCTGRASVNDNTFTNINGQNNASNDCVAFSGAISYPVIRGNRHKSTNAIERLVDASSCVGATIMDNVSESATAPYAILEGTSPRLWP